MYEYIDVSLDSTQIPIPRYLHMTECFPEKLVFEEMFASKSKMLRAVLQ